MHWCDVCLRSLLQGVPGRVRLVTGDDIGRVVTGLLNHGSGWDPCRQAERQDWPENPHRGVRDLVRAWLLAHVPPAGSVAALPAVRGAGGYRPKHT